LFYSRRFHQTLGEYLDFWLEKVVKVSARYSTYTAYQGYIKNHIKPILGNVVLSELKTVQIQEFVSSLANGQRLGARTIGIVITMLGNALNYAEDYEYILKNPCKRLKLPKITEEEVVAFSNDEHTRIEKAIIASAEPRMIGFMIMLYTGVRLGELCALKWEQVDLKTKCMWVKFSMTRIVNVMGKTKTVMSISEPKTKQSKRTIILPDFICDRLKTLRKSSNSDYVISEPSGTFVNPRTMQKLFKKLLAETKVYPRKLHTLRHTFTVRALELGADVKTVSVTLGHSDATITLNRYAHSLIEQKQKIMRGLNNYFKSKGI
jgi:integrase